MKLSRLLFFLLSVFSSSAMAANIWEAGQLTYPNNETEISAFVNGDGGTQLQAVLCSQNSSNSYRFTLLLPHKLETDSVIKVVLKADEQENEYYAEVSGNSIDIQIDESLMLSIPDSSKLQLCFEEDTANFLGIPKTIDVSMSGADMTIRNVASECTVLCLSGDFKCNYPLLSSILWPRDHFNSARSENIDELCTVKVGQDRYKFNPSEGCKLALDRFYKKDGRGPLSYIYTLFNDKELSFSKYVQYWNELVSLSPYSPLNLPVDASNNDWYLILYSLIGNIQLREFPSSYYEIKDYKKDPTTLIYDVDNRYEMEVLKYDAVLYRRLKGSLSALETLEKALKCWNDFYRVLTVSLPNITQAQAIRPIIYREMLMRVWNLAGKPEGLKFSPENMFVHGMGGKTTTSEPLEAHCSFFDGANGAQFFFGSAECVNWISDYMRTSPLNTDLYVSMRDAWDNFAVNWTKSMFFSDGIDDAVGENPRAKLSLVTMSLFKLYGFGDYFLVRECISSRDADICGFSLDKAYQTYSKEYKYRLDAIANVSSEDANVLNKLNKLWLEYYRKLCAYADELVQKGLIEYWRADFVKSLACIIQINALLNLSYYREELPDISLDEESYMDINKIKNAQE